MTRIAVLSRSGPELAKIHGTLQEAGGLFAKAFTSLEETEKGLITFAPQALVLHLAFLGDQQVERLLGVRKRFPTLPLVVIACEIDDAARFRLNRLAAFALIHFQNEMQDLPRTLLRLIDKQESYPRAHARARRTDKVEIRDAKGRLFQGRFEDYGRMGAKLAVAANALRDGDRVLLQYASTSGEAMRKIEAIVVWQAAASAWPVGLLGGGLIGVKFIAYL